MTTPPLLLQKIQFPFAVSLTLYLLLWIACLGALWYIWQRPKQRGFFTPWTTQDIMIVAIMGVMLEAYDNMIGDQFISPLVHIIPILGGILGYFQLHDLPYMFMLMVGVAMIRKPGCVTAMVFVNYLLMQLLYGGSGDNPLQWPDGLTQGIMVDMYIVWRRGEVFNDAKRIFWDGLIMGFFRAVPNTPFGGLIMDPVLSAQYHSTLHFLSDMFSNGLGNGLEAALTAPLAIRVAKSVHLLAGESTQISDAELGTAGPVGRESLKGSE